MHLFPKTNIDFIGWRWRFFTISAVLLGGSVISLATRGVRYGIDFTGGTVLQLTFEKPIELSTLRAAVEKAGLKHSALQHFAGSNTFAIRIQEAAQSAELIDKQLAAIQISVGQDKFHLDSKEYVGPSVGRHLFRQALWAIVLSLGGIILYLAFRFDNPIWGVAGIIALFHDILATYGLFSLLGFEVDLLIISALLTIGGYSIHDTIIILDRMREKLHVMRKESLRQVIDESINETLSRTIITSGTVLAVVTILWAFGGKVIHDFAMAMVFGTVVGTYSSIAVAAPLVYEWSLRTTKGRASETAVPLPNRPRPVTRKDGRA